MVRSMISFPELILLNVEVIWSFEDDCVFYGKGLGFRYDRFNWDCVFY